MVVLPLEGQVQVRNTFLQFHDGVGDCESDCARRTRSWPASTRRTEATPKWSDLANQSQRQPNFFFSSEGAEVQSDFLFGEDSSGQGAPRQPPGHSSQEEAQEEEPGFSSQSFARSVTEGACSRPAPSRHRQTGERERAGSGHHGGGNAGAWTPLEEPWLGGLTKDSEDKLGGPSGFSRQSTGCFSRQTTGACSSWRATDDGSCWPTPTYSSGRHCFSDVDLEDLLEGASASLLAAGPGQAPLSAPAGFKPPHRRPAEELQAPFSPGLLPVGMFQTGPPSSPGVCPTRPPLMQQMPMQQHQQQPLLQQQRHQSVQQLQVQNQRQQPAAQTPQQPASPQQQMVQQQRLRQHMQGPPQQPVSPLQPQSPLRQQPLLQQQQEQQRPQPTSPTQLPTLLQQQPRGPAPAAPKPPRAPAAAGEEKVTVGQLPNAVTCTYTADGGTSIFWEADARKLNGSDKMVVSPEFPVRLPGVGPQPFRMLIYASAPRNDRGSLSFRTTGGRGRVELKCGSQLPGGLPDVAVSVGAGSGERAQPMRGPVAHNFLHQSCCGLKPDEEEWDFRSSVNSTTKRLTIRAELSPLVKRA